jgi:hypothetical protein
MCCIAALHSARSPAAARMRALYMTDGDAERRRWQCASQKTAFAA